MDFIQYKPEFDNYPDSETEDERDEDLAMDYGCILQLTDLNFCQSVFDVKIEESIEEPMTVEPTMEEITADFNAIYILQRGLSVPKAVKQCMIPRSSAYPLLKEFNAEFLVELLDKNPSSTPEMAKVALAENFVGFTISLPSLWKPLTECCHFSLKQASKYNADRNSERTLVFRC
ncbi:hypothetical protein INT47_001740, partial [Mucor saturninus]